MKTNNMFNKILNQIKNPNPEIGMGATRLCCTDRQAYTIIEILTQKRILVRRDKAILNNGVYTYEQDSNGFLAELSLRKDGSWIAVGESLKTGIKFSIGRRDEFYDTSF